MLYVGWTELVKNKKAYESKIYCNKWGYLPRIVRSNTVEQEIYKDPWNR